MMSLPLESAPVAFAELVDAETAGMVALGVLTFVIGCSGVPMSGQSEGAPPLMGSTVNAAGPVSSYGARVLEE